MAELSGKVALVTGGGSGIGEACATALARRGAQVVVADIDPTTAERVARRLETPGLACRLDVRESASVQAAVDLATSRFGRLDIAVNNAGVGVPVKRDIGEMSWTDWTRVTSVNLDGVFRSMRAELPAMLASGGGSVINMASVAAHIGIAGAGAYVAAKHAVLGLTKCAAAEYATRNIRVNVVCPGFVDTAISPRTGTQKQALGALHPMNRLGTPEEVAEVVAFLAGDAASFVTGSAYDVDGGYVSV
ncbi:SDR family NAD(P)-dependent oxidoreductase [Streptomyces sp. NPDC058001]|uniref:SDR family NAD(P)-dependent oxidoreductase n=1 Tax=Streptomyces sp. NPDC058001 TaxID=3346300 RepID=UPI0036E5B30E